MAAFIEWPKYWEFRVLCKSGKEKIILEAVLDYLVCELVFNERIPKEISRS